MSTTQSERLRGLLEPLVGNTGAGSRRDRGDPGRASDECCASWWTPTTGVRAGHLSPS